MQWKSTYSEDDGGLLGHFLRNIHVHLEVGRVGTEVVDAHESGRIDNRGERSEAAEDGRRDVHVDSRFSCVCVFVNESATSRDDPILYIKLTPALPTS
jgi:hypothetical protein